MDERTRRMIAEYIPHPRDPELDDGKYYYLHETMGGARVIRLYALDILPHREGVEYGIYQQRGGRLVRIDSGWGDPSRGVRMHDLYDNRDDCRDRTHYFLDSWEQLRDAESEG